MTLGWTDPQSGSGVSACFTLGCVSVAWGIRLTTIRLLTSSQLRLVPVPSGIRRSCLSCDPVSSTLSRSESLMMSLSSKMKLSQSLAKTYMKVLPTVLMCVIARACYLECILKSLFWKHSGSFTFWNLNQVFCSKTGTSTYGNRTPQTQTCWWGCKHVGWTFFFVST